MQYAQPTCTLWFCVLFLLGVCWLVIVFHFLTFALERHPSHARLISLSVKWSSRRERISWESHLAAPSFCLASYYNNQNPRKASEQSCLVKNFKIERKIRDDRRKMADKKSEVRIPEEHLHLNGKAPPIGEFLVDWNAWVGKLRANDEPPTVVYTVVKTWKAILNREYGWCFYWSFVFGAKSTQLSEC